MKMFEYKIEYIGWQSGTRETVLSISGENGWELVSVVDNALYFKKETKQKTHRLD